MSELLHTIQRFESLNAIAASDWKSLESPDFPFADYEFLLALENSRAAVEETGFKPEILTVWNGSNLCGATYLHLKTHSYGEYIFDWAWAEAYHRHQVAYFPKLTASTPFTPATGPKLLLSPDCDRKAVAACLIQAGRERAEALGVSSLHYLFLAPEELPYFESAGLSLRHSFQYHWRNQSYATFDDFLAQLKSRKRKQILKERESVKEHGLDIRLKRGTELTPEDAETFFRFYQSTIEKQGAIPYLNLPFFKQVFQTMGDRVFTLTAAENNVPIAGALYYEKGRTLFGRYWGATKEISNLHFELCYYHPIQYAIERKLTRFEAGAQGEHKLARGFTPELTYSAHWIRHPQFKEAIDQFIDEEKRGIAAYFKAQELESPYRAQDAL